MRSPIDARRERSEARSGSARADDAGVLGEGVEPTSRRMVSLELRARGAQSPSDGRVLRQQLPPFGTDHRQHLLADELMMLPMEARQHVCGTNSTALVQRGPG
jgi:hypothetical protein